MAGNSRWLRFGLTLFGLGVLLAVAHFVVVPLWLPTAIVYAPNFGKKMDPRDDANSAQLSFLGLTRQLRIAVGPPAASISVWIMEPTTTAERPQGTVFVFHGIRDKKNSMLGTGRMLANAGYRVVLPDLRGHGQSSGDWLTYGVVESQDMVEILNELASQGLLTHPVAAFGCSYGGAIALQLAARDARVKRIVTVATFTSLHEAVRCSARQFVPGWAITESMIEKAVFKAGQLANFTPSEASSLTAITRTKAKVLLIHGKQDKKLPPSFSQALHEAAPDHSELILVEGADHDSIMRETTAGLKDRILSWLACK